MTKPNVLWIQTDEQRPDSLGCYGSAWARTPNVDALASKGIVFRNCVCNSPVCVPSRASQLTGRYPQEICTLHNQVGEKEAPDSPQLGSGARVFPPGTVTFPEVFAAAGYATASFGKSHIPPHALWQRNERLVNLLSYAGYYGLNARYDEEAHQVLKRPAGAPIILSGVYPTAEGHPSQVITDRAIAWLRELPAGQPFLLRVSHNWPHTPVLPPPPFDTRYDPDEIPIRYYDASVYGSRAACDRRRADASRMQDLSRDQVRQMWQAYMGLVACVDHETGRMLEALRAMGLEENTLVLFSSDHGKSLGEWGATEKGFFDSEVWRVPFVLAGPGVPPRPPEEGVCELLDTGVTLLELAGLDVPAQMRGRNLITTPAPEAVFAQIGWPDSAAPLLRDAGVVVSPVAASMRVAVRTQRYRMDVTWYQDGRRLPVAEADGNLFDLVEDPGETRNLWPHPEGAWPESARMPESARAVVEDLWHRLETWQAGLDQPAGLFS